MKFIRLNRELRYRLNKGKRTKTIGASIDKFFKHHRLEGQFAEAHIQSEWKNIVGPLIANHTQSIYLKGQKLYLKIDSAPLRNEMLMSKKLLVSNINNTIGEECVNQIIFI